MSTITRSDGFRNSLPSSPNPERKEHGIASSTSLLLASIQYGIASAVNYFYMHKQVHPVGRVIETLSEGNQDATFVSNEGTEDNDIETFMMEKYERYVKHAIMYIAHGIAEELLMDLESTQGQPEYLRRGGYDSHKDLVEQISQLVGAQAYSEYKSKVRRSHESLELESEPKDHTMETAAYLVLNVRELRDSACEVLKLRLNEERSGISNILHDHMDEAVMRVIDSMIRDYLSALSKSRQNTEKEILESMGFASIDDLIIDYAPPLARQLTTLPEGSVVDQVVVDLSAIYHTMPTEFQRYMNRQEAQKRRINDNH